MKIDVDCAQIQGQNFASSYSGVCTLVTGVGVSNRKSDLIFFLSWIIVTFQLRMFTQTTTTSPSSPDVDVISTITTSSY